MKNLIKSILIIGVGFVLSSCTKVEPWEKENFAKASMSLKDWSMPDSAVQKTMYKALAPSKGGTGLGGGGCGCG